MIKPTIYIYDAIGLGLIIDYPSGIMISNQTGGTACLHPSREGIYLPLCNDINVLDKTILSPSVELCNYFTTSKHNGTGATNGLDKEDITRITEILTQYNLDKYIVVDEEKKLESHEAWIIVKIKNLDLLKYFPENLTGVLTWENSD